MLLRKLNSKLSILRTFMFTRNCSSALYITGDRAQNMFSVLTPHIDVVERFEDREALERNIRARGKAVDLDGIANRWGFYQNLLEKRSILEETKNEISKRIILLKNEEKSSKNEEEITKLQTHFGIVKDEYSTLKNFMYGVEESAALKALSLPNILHSRTPLEDAHILVNHLSKPQNTADNFPSNVQIGIENELLEMYEDKFAFLINEAAYFEQAVLNCFQAKLNQSSLIQFSNADFVKSVIIEGCGSDFSDKNDVITLQNESEKLINRLHLVGGASHFAFIAHFTKYLIPFNQMPLKYFTVGRKYQPTVDTGEPSLFNLTQQSAIEVFVATTTAEEMDKSLDELIELIEGLYKSLDCHFRIVLVPANKLRNYESLRVAIEMFSNHSGAYFEIGSVSVLDEYISKRLLISYTQNKQRKFAKLIVGNVLNVQKLLGCILENNWNNGKLNTILNDMLMNYIP